MYINGGIGIAQPKIVVVRSAVPGHQYFHFIIINERAAVAYFKVAGITTRNHPFRGIICLKGNFIFMAQKIVRSICYFTDNPLAETATKLDALARRLEEKGYLIQTKRVCSAV